MCARRRSHFLCLAKESNQRKATPLAASLRFAAGNLRCSRAGCAVELTSRLQRSVQTSPASQITMRVHPSVHPLTPPAALLGASRGEGDNHTGHRCARPWVLLTSCGSGLARDECIRRTEAPSRESPLPHPVIKAERSDGSWGLHLPSGRVEKRRAWGAGAAAQHAALRDLTRCGCLSEVNAVNEASSAAPPHVRASQVAPERSAGDTAGGVAFLLPTFLWRDKEK